MNANEARATVISYQDALGNAIASLDKQLLNGTLTTVVHQTDMRLIRDAQLALRTAVDSVPFGSVSLPDKSPGNVTWNLNNAVAKAKGALSAANLPTPKPPSLVDEIITRAKEVGKDPLSLGGILPSWVKWTVLGVGGVLLIALFLRVRGK